MTAVNPIQRRFIHLPLTAVDGGIGVLYETAQLRIGVVRAASVTYAAGKRTASCIVEAIVYAQNTEKGWTLRYDRASDIFSTAPTELAQKQEPFDAVRTWLETALLRQSLQPDSFLLADGWPINQELSEAVQKQQGILVGIAKQTTQHSSPLNQGGLWYVQGNDISWCRLHEKAICNFSLMIAGSPDLDKLFGCLAYYATDPVFFGYPYPLIFADTLARVSNQELPGYQASVLHTVADGKLLEEESIRFNPHKILDKLQY